MSEQLATVNNTSERTNSDLLAEHNAREAALGGHWNKFVHEGAENNVRHIAIEAQHPEAEFIPVTVGHTESNANLVDASL